MSDGKVMTPSEMAQCVESFLRLTNMLFWASVPDNPALQRAFQTIEDALRHQYQLMPGPGPAITYTDEKDGINNEQHTI